MTNSYYWSDDWSEEFYVELAKAGFISTTYDTKDGLVLLPELQFDYAILDFKELHISKKVKKLLKEDEYEFCVDTRFDEVIQKVSNQHRYNWMRDEYVELLQRLHPKSTSSLSLTAHVEQREDFKLLSFELVSKEDNELVAGEIGYVIQNIYTSLTGFSSREKKYNNCGNLQLVLLSQYLEKNDFNFWNLGHPHMLYKQKLGAKTYTRNEFLKRWSETIH